ncbi:MULTISPECIES: DUF3883 domain-containing protein [unclassified Pedobacter]|uniref:DUF3883 domain-containing protein n=1 Tax=unclassified Pedobacter TaxID=2628915 RepID=UPI001E12EE7A|nr:MULTISPECIES: DUF3883 domain-containing protein [unclassified Pedobacter]CAH0140785.1 hypothetical protein SRABI36_00539 [Pedobacter sp. Bi36]CAH0196512.1 hypothetical protein SRABI126_01633 [Pedobacter sp. Bi126]
MTQNFKQEILDLIEVSRNTYAGMPLRITADYDNEKGLISAYNGRQILEMLQNADDAGANKVQIKLDIEKTELTISNSGEPFNKGGVQSLMLAGASKKTKKSYIGNKGLGFRSVLNWSDLVEIDTNGCVLSFSQEIAKEAYQALPLTDKQWQELRTGWKYRDTTIPFAILAIPDVKDSKATDHTWATSIKITYGKYFEKDIIKQMELIGEECLLFLNHIEELSILGLESGDRVFKKDKLENDRSDQITVNGKQWEVYKVEGMYEDGKDKGDQYEDEYYSIKVAVNEKLSDDIGTLFSFFPTLVSFPLPCVVHATFELDPSRNAIVKSDKNVFLLDELKKLLISITEDMAAGKHKWNAYRLLTPLNENSDNPQVKTFYQELKSARDAAQIFPTIGGGMRLLNQIRYYGNDFTQFIQGLETEYFDELLWPFDERVSSIQFNGKRYSDFELMQRVNLVSPALNIVNRALMIKFLSSYEFNNHKQQYTLLVDKDGNIIPVGHTCYTPILADGAEYELPSFLEIAFMNTKLYLELTELFTKRELPASSRELQIEIKEVVNVQPYDSNLVTERIINRANALILNKSNEEKKAVVFEMVRALWSNFSTSPKSGRYGGPVPLVNLSLGVNLSNTLLYSLSYPKGKLIADIYGETLQDYQYVAPLSFYSLKTAPEAGQHDILVQDFFRWLGVNDLSIIESRDTVVSSDHDYYRYVDKNHAGFVWGSKLQIIDSEIMNFDNIQRKMSLEQLILWAIKCERVQQALKSSASDVLITKNNKAERYRELRSYIHHQFLYSGKIKNYIIENYGIPSVNRNMIDYKSELFTTYGISKPDIDSTLLKLGAVETFEQLSAERVFELLSLSKNDDPEGRYTQRLYKLALKWYDDFHGELPGRPYIAYFAKKGDEQGYGLGKVYYSDNQALPKHILKDFAILDLPKRSGEDKVAKLFQISNFKDISLSIIPGSISRHPHEQKFQAYWLQIRDMVLAYRIEKLNASGERRAAASQIKQFKINLVSAGSFDFDGQRMEMQENNMINIGNQFYLQVGGTTGDLGQLKKSPEFCDAFAESLCILFKVTEQKNDFRRLFKNDIADSRHLITQDLGNGTWADAKVLLGVSDLEQLFWKRIFSLKGIDVEGAMLEEGITDEALIDIFGGGSFGYLPGLMDNLSAQKTFEFLKALCTRLELNLKVLIQDLDIGDGFRTIHLDRIEVLLKDLKQDVKKSLWKKLSKGTLEEKMLYKHWFKQYQYLREKLVPLVSAYDYSFELPYRSEVLKCIFNVFSIDNLEGLHDIDPDNLYPDLYNDLQGISLSDELQSLFYFADMAQEIQNRAPNRDSGPEDILLDADPSDYHLEILNGSDFSAGTFLGDSGTEAKRAWVADPGIDNAKRNAGKRSEEAVFNHLVKIYGKENVDWRSGYSHVLDRDDSIHYDIEYRNEEAVWKMLEVKTLNINTFIITRKEVEKGCKHWKDYELALVSHGKISIIKDFFKDADPSQFDGNNSYLVTPRDYYVTINRKQSEAKSTAFNEVQDKED